jgi:hypothetical protein
MMGAFSIISFIVYITAKGLTDAGKAIDRYK